MSDNTWPVDKIPSSPDLESKAVLRALVRARAALAELKGIARTIPDQSILINTLGIQEVLEKNRAGYRLLQEVRTQSNWEEWLLYMIDGVYVTAKDTILLIESLQVQITDMTQKLRSEYKFYSHELLMNLFRHPYTKIEFVKNELGVSRKTASHYLNTLANDGILRKEKLGKGTYFVNEDLYHLFLMR